VRSCIFCGDRASSKEDAWPRWLVRLLPTGGGVQVEAERDGTPLKGWQTIRHENSSHGHLKAPWVV